MGSSSDRLHSGHVQFITQTTQWTCAVHQADCTVKVNMGSSSDRLHSGHVQFIRHTACRLNMRWANAHTHNPYYKNQRGLLDTTASSEEQVTILRRTGGMPSPGVSLLVCEPPDQWITRRVIQYDFPHISPIRPMRKQIRPSHSGLLTRMFPDWDTGRFNQRNQR
ncbi:hypothetical protein M8J76_006001 [Diaphorina citri]|nr:hypothetical protein M8J76_006001 [Diaphorina citri]